MTHEVRVARRAIKQLSQLQRQDQQRIRAAIDLLSEEPPPTKSKKLAGEDNVFRVRVGSYRILYSIDDGQLTVLVVAIGHRQGTYRPR